MTKAALQGVNRHRRNEQGRGAVPARPARAFWLVKPSVTLAGITGLETLVSGNYVATSPGEGEPTRKFKALAEEPPLSDAKPGLHLTHQG